MNWKTQEFGKGGGKKWRMLGAQAEKRGRGQTMKDSMVKIWLFFRESGRKGTGIY